MGAPTYFGSGFESLGELRVRRGSPEAGVLLPAPLDVSVGGAGPEVPLAVGAPHVVRGHQRPRRLCACVSWAGKLWVNVAGK